MAAKVLRTWKPDDPMKRWGREGAADLEAPPLHYTPTREPFMRKYISIVALLTIVAAAINLVTENELANLAMILGLGAQVVMWSIVANRRTRRDAGHRSPPCNHG